MVVPLDLITHSQQCHCQPGTLKFFDVLTLKKFKRGTMSVPQRRVASRNLAGRPTMARANPAPITAI